MSTCHMRRRGSSARLQKRKTSREFTISGSENRSSASYQLQWYLQESAKETTSTDGPTCPRIFSCWTQVDPTLSTGAQVSHGGWKIPTMKIMIMMHMMIMVMILILMMILMMLVMMMMLVRLLQRVEEDALIALPLTKGFHHFHQMDKIDPTLRVKCDLPPLRCRSQTAAGSQPRLCHWHEGHHLHHHRQ